MGLKNTYLKTVALVMIFGPVALLWLAVSYGLLSDREWAIGGLVWAALLPLVFVVLRRWLSSKIPASSTESVEADDRTPRPMLLGTWLIKGWFVLLAISLPFGIAIGAAHRAWQPTLFGALLNVFLMYLAMQEIKRRKRFRNHLTPKP